MRTIRIYCDGGFGNRFNALMSGMAIAEAAGLLPIVVWPTNNWCGARYEDLFEGPARVENRELASFVAEKDRYCHLKDEDHLGMAVPNAAPAGFAQWDLLLAHIAADTRDVFYYVALIPPCVELGRVLRQIARHPFQGWLRERAETFIRTRGLQDFLGVQIRKTDFGANGADDNALFALISGRPDRQFFVCSDDAQVEARFAQLPNVHVYAKQAHVQKRIDGDWNHHTADHSGRVYPCNVERSALSVAEAIVDLQILARSQIVRTSGSTFLSAALLLRASAASGASAPPPQVLA